MIAKKITIARVEKKEIKKVELKKLSESALKEVSKNFLMYPELKNLDYKYKLRVTIIINIKGI
jgi:hypothetical protein